MFKAKIIAVYYEVKGNNNKKWEGETFYCNKVLTRYVHWCKAFELDCDE